MSDEATLVSGGSTPSPDATQTTDQTTNQGVDVGASASIVNSDGSFSEDWRNSLPEDLRAEPSLQNYRDLGSMAKSLVNAQKLVGADKIVMPTEKSSPEEWDEFYNKLGRPEDASKYTLEAKELPEGTEVDQELIGAFKDQAFELGLNQSQAEKLFDWYNQTIGGKIQEEADHERMTIETATAELKKDWGMAFDDQLSLAQRAAKTFELSEEFDKLGLGNNPTVLKAMAKIGAAISEDKMVGTTKAMIPLDAQVKINEIMGNRNHPYHDAEHPSHGDAVKEMARLFQQAEGA